MQITSSSNPEVKFIRKLKEKKARKESGLFYIEGLRIVIEAFEKKAPIETLITNSELLRNDRGLELVENARSQGIEILEVSNSVFESISLKENPQGLAAVVKQQVIRLDDLPTETMGLWTAFDEIADPGNLGTVMRTMDAVGGKGIILIGPSVDPFDPSAIRASMGALFSLKIVKTPLKDFTEWKKIHSIMMVGTSDKAIEIYTEFKYPRDLIILMGSERQGIQSSLVDLCDKIVRIPMVGSSDSLNLSIANAIVLYEIFNQTHLNRPGWKNDRIN